MPTNVASSILVLGVGELGRAMLPPLVAKAKAAGVAVSVLVHQSAGEQHHFVKSLGCEIVDGDLVAMSIETLSGIFARFDTILNCVGFAIGAGTQIKLARAVLRAGIDRYFPWQFGIDYDLCGRGSCQEVFDEQLDVRALLRGQEQVKWVVISTGMFLSFLFEPAFGVVDLPGGIVNALGSLENEVTVTTPEDIGLLTAKILFAQPRIENEVVYVAGDTIAYGQLAGLIAEKLAVPFQTHFWDAPFLEGEIAKEPDDVMRKYRAVFAKEAGMAWPIDGTFNVRNGIPVTDIRTWIEENRNMLMSRMTQQA
ncbi:aromatic alcohol reductase [Sphingobium sp.]|uniref:aromatic alcohol reductase n=1 Tax=Sphingobium sp. TaxID=1912891 RepID=UPI002C12D356|nr:aromatic alcohol reductase [Sphingobium sp.]HUD93481.1 aromatic alcohol reductase [Sphingobium sp.]